MSVVPPFCSSSHEESFSVAVLAQGSAFLDLVSWAVTALDLPPPAAPAPWSHCDEPASAPLVAAFLTPTLLSPPSSWLGRVWGRTVGGSHHDSLVPPAVPPQTHSHALAPVFGFVQPTGRCGAAEFQVLL